MKKYILMMLVVLVAGFTSCSNDDIPMEEKVTKKVFDTTFIVDPSGVVEGYDFEAHPGELSIIPEGAALRIRLLIYDSDGEIVEMITRTQYNYQSPWSINTELEAGDYTVLAISDVRNINDPDVDEYWTLGDYGKINEATLTKNIMWLGYQKEILGMTHLQFIVDSSNSISINLKPAGAACYFTIADLERYSNVVSYLLLTDHRVNYVFWDSSFNLKVNKEIAPGPGSGIIDGFNTEVGGVVGLDEIDFGNTTGNAFTAFFYLLPSQKQYFQFVAETTGYVDIGLPMYQPEIKAGEQYYFLCELGSEYNNYAQTRSYNVTGKTFEEWYDEWSWDNLKVYKNSRVMNINNEIPKSVFKQKTNNVVYIKDLIKK